jgi:hypothetical protein
MNTAAITPTETADVPDRYRGVWTRTLLETPDVRDTTTWVHWLQTARWHADLRVSAAAEVGREARPLAQLSSAQHHALSLQQGFFGRTEVISHAYGDICTWHRRLDLQPPGPNPDAGWMEFESADRVIETGVHGAYREVWERLPDSVGRHMVLSRLSAADDASAGSSTHLLLSGDWLMRVRPRRLPWPFDTAVGDTMEGLLARHPGSALGLLDFEISFGRLHEGQWSISRSSLPELEGVAAPISFHRVGPAKAEVQIGIGAPEGAGTSAWRILEWDGLDG